MIFAFPIHFYDAGERNRSQLRVSQWRIQERGAPGVESDGRRWRPPQSQPGSSVGLTAGSLVQRVSRAQSSENDGCALYLQRAGRQIFQGDTAGVVPGKPGAPTKANTYTVARNKRRRRALPRMQTVRPAPLHLQSRERTTLDATVPLCHGGVLLSVATNKRKWSVVNKYAPIYCVSQKAALTSTLRDKVPWTSWKQLKCWMWL